MGNPHSNTPLQNWATCTKCRLHRHRRNVVVLKQNIIHCPTKDQLPCRNEGKHKGIHRITPLPPGKEWLADWYVNCKLKHILVVGIAPGESEDLHGEPFYGISGNILNTLFAYSFSSFLATFTNVVCCRPSHNPETTVDEKQWGKNRDPEPSEISLCKDHITQILQSYKFSGILTLGNLASQNINQIENKLPKLSLHHPAFIARLNFKLFTIRTEAAKLSKWLKTLE